MESIAGYQLDKLLHRGPKTAVHRGRRQSDDAPVIIKQLTGSRPRLRQLDGLQRLTVAAKDHGAHRK